MLDDVARFRRFARAVTTEVGALDDSFLGRPRSLGAARVLNAIGQGRTEVSDIRACLRLDSGLMSRLLRGLEEEGLISNMPSTKDGRRRTLQLTEEGRREFLVYEQLSDERAGLLLDGHGRRGDLLAALDLVASALLHDRVEFRIEDPRTDRSRNCLAQYYAELAQSFDGGFEVELSRDPRAEEMMPPVGAFIIAMSDGLPVGCVGLKGRGGEMAEVKRLWVSPTARGVGLAYRLMDEVERVARDLSIKHLRLDTNRALQGALHLYRRSGWLEIARFNSDPYADFFFEKAL